jgi:uncharacterized protein
MTSAAPARDINLDESLTTKAGKPYNQTYCYVCRVADGEVRELTEYLDTDLVNRALEMPTDRSG